MRNLPPYVRSRAVVSSIRRFVRTCVIARGCTYVGCGASLDTGAFEVVDLKRLVAYVGTYVRRLVDVVDDGGTYVRIGAFATSVRSR